MHAHLTDTALQGKGIFEHILGQFRTVFQFILELGDQAVAVFEIDFDIFLLPVRPFFAQVFGNQFGEAVGLIDGHVADTGDILEGALRRHCTECNDTRHMVDSVLFLDITVCLGQVLEVHIYIRHADTVRIEETLKQKLILDRVQIGNLEAVSHHRTCRRATPGTYHRAHSAGCCDIVLYYQEVVGESHLADGLELKVYTLRLLVIEGIPISHPRTLIGQITEIRHGAAEVITTVFARLVVLAAFDDIGISLHIGIDVRHEVVRQLEFGQDIIPVYTVFLDFVRYLKGIGDDLRMLGEHGSHFLRALDVFLLGIMQAVRIIYIRIGSQADKTVMRRSVLFEDKMRVIGRHDLDAFLLRQSEQSLVVDFLMFVDFLGKSRHFGLVQLHFKVIVLSEHPFMPPHGLSCGLVFAGKNILRYLARHTRRAADEPLVITLQYLMRDPGLVVESLHMAVRTDLDEVFVALGILGEQYKVIVLPVVLVLERRVIMPGHIYLAAYDRLDRGVLGSMLEKLLDAVHIAVVGNRNGRHAEFFDPVKQLGHGGKSIKDGILGVYV